MCDPLTTELKQSQSSVNLLDCQLSNLRNDQQELNLEWCDLQKINALIKSVQQDIAEYSGVDIRGLINQKNDMDSDFRHYARKLIKDRQLWIDRFGDLNATISQLVDRILKEKESNVNCDQLQEYFETIASIISQINRILSTFETMVTRIRSGDKLIQDVKLQITNFTKLLAKLVQNLLILEEQPQAIEKDGKIELKVRVLIGGQLGVQLFLPKVTASLISKTQFNCLHNQPIDEVITTSCGELANNWRFLEYSQHSGQLTAVFTNLVIKSLETDCHAILLQTQFNVGDQLMNGRVTLLTNSFLQ
jgi:hypothetical protein